MSSCVSAPYPAQDLVRGRARLVGDMKLPGMLHGRMLLSPVSHGRISGLELKKALGLPGVKAAVTAADLPGGTAGLLAFEEALYAGQPVAALAAVSPELAEKALGAVSAQYEELPAVLDWSEALAEGVDLVSHTLSTGDPDAAFAGADLVIEDNFELPGIDPLPPEPWACLAAPGGSGLTLWTNNLCQEGAAEELAQILGLASGELELISLAQPGAPLCACGPQAWELCAAALALKSGRPVRTVLSRAEEFALAPRTTAMRVHSKLGLDKEGRILARELTWDLQGGAQAGDPEAAAWLAAQAALPYGTEAARIEVRLAQGNLAPGSLLPGLAGLAPGWAMESQLSQAALELGLDPVQIRQTNLMQPGAESLGLAALPTHDLRGCLDQISQSGWPKADNQGLACFAALSGSLQEPKLFSGALGLEAEFEADTAELKVSKLELVHDAADECGFDPALILGLSLARSEELTMEQGRVVNHSPASYRQPLLSELPSRSQTGLGQGAPDTPWAAACAVIPALAHALGRLSGWQADRIPLTPEWILRGMGKILG